MLTLRKLSQKIKDMNKFVTMCIQHAVWLNQNSELKIMVALHVQEWTPQFQTEATCHVTPSTHSLFHCRKELMPQRQARLTGGTGLYMNYSIIFTEICFYPETSILLQIVRIIYMTFRIMPEFDR